MSDAAKIEANKATIERFMEIINSRDFGALPEVCQPNLVRHCPATPGVVVRSIEDMVAFLEQDLKAVPDAVLTAKMGVYEGDFAGAWSSLMNLVTSIAMIGLLVTGPWIWLRRRLRPRQRRVRQAATA